MARGYDVMTPWSNRTITYQPPKKFRGGSTERLWKEPKTPTRQTMKHKSRLRTPTATKTKKKKKPIFQKGTDGINYAQISVNYKKTKMSRAVADLSSRSQLFEIKSSGVASLIGRQNAEIVNAIEAGNNTATSDLLRLYLQLKQSSSIPLTAQSNKFLLKTIVHEVEFANAAPTTVECEYFWCLDKITGPNDGFNAINYWAQGLPKESDTATVALQPLITDPWEIPTTNKGFNIRYWTRRIKFPLTPGEHKKIKIVFRVNRLMDTQYINDFHSIRGITHEGFLIVKGTVADSTQTTTITAAGQTIAPSKVVWIAKKTQTGELVNINPLTRRTVGTRLPQPASLFAIDEDQGDPENVLDPAEYA